MKAVMSITDSGSWALELKAETPVEKAMLVAVSRGHGVQCTCGEIGTPEEPALRITGEERV